MFLKVMHVPKDPKEYNCEYECVAGGSDVESSAYIISDVAEVNFIPREFVRTNFLSYLVGGFSLLNKPRTLRNHPEAKPLALLSDFHVEKRDEDIDPGDQEVMMVSVLEVLLINGNRLVVFFDDRAFLCSDSGKTVEKFDASYTVKANEAVRDLPRIRAENERRYAALSKSGEQKPLVPPQAPPSIKA